MTRYNFSTYTNNEIATLTVAPPPPTKPQSIAWSRCVSCGLCAALLINTLLAAAIVGPAYIGAGTGYAEKLQRDSVRFGVALGR